MISDLVTGPRAFITERTKYRGTRTQVIIAIIAGLAFGVQHVGSYYQLDENIAIDLYEVLVLHFSINVLAPFAIWIAATALITIMGRFLVGRFRTGDVFRLSGWGLLPLVPSGLVRTAGRLYGVRGASPPDLGKFSYLGYEWDQYQLYLEFANSEPVFMLATVVAALFVIHTGYIWMMVVEALGEREGIDVDTGSAALLAGIPALLCLAWILAPYIV